MKNTIAVTGTSIYNVTFATWQLCEEAQKSPYVLAKTLKSRGYTSIRYWVEGDRKPVLTQNIDGILRLGRLVGGI